MKKGWKKFAGQIGKIVLAASLLLVLAKAWETSDPERTGSLSFTIRAAAVAAGQDILRQIWNQFYPAPEIKEQERRQVKEEVDPSYRSVRAMEAFIQEHEYLAVYGNEESGFNGVEEEINFAAAAVETETEAEGGTEADQGEMVQTVFAVPGQTYQLAQLMDYDFLMSHFYNVHTSTTAGRDLMDAKKLLSQDFQLAESGQTEPQILIYHTHSQESYEDSEPGETVTGVGAYLAQLLEEKGFSVYHDQSVYDVRDGKLDRNKAYTYALEGISKILEENPSIQVVIDLHRDGVQPGTHLVTEINGKPTARVMFFNGLSQTPEGPIPYLNNPYREDNLAFSLQLQLKAAAYYPGFTRKIYLKGLRYNQHLRPCSCLIEVGAQTNTYEEAKNAMEPLAEVFSKVLHGN